MTFGLNIGLEFPGPKQTATPKWLCDKKIILVGATGFEPVTSTV